MKTNLNIYSDVGWLFLIWVSHLTGEEEQNSEATPNKTEDSPDVKRDTL